MDIFAEMQPRIEAFKIARENVVSSAVLPTTDGAMSCGKPPFAIDDGTDYYAVIDANGNVSPLPFSYQLADEDIEMDDAAPLFCCPMVTAGSGVNIVTYVPLVEDFEVPGEKAFCLETAEDSESWSAVEQVAGAIQQMVNEKASSNFNQALANMVSRIHERYDEFESLDQSISALAQQSSLPLALLLRSYREALDALEEELTAPEDEDDEL
jgi:hypothetical protein